MGALHSVSVWASEFGLSLGQVACAEKSNEITAIPELLRLVDIKGAIITIDAMGAQKAIAAEIIDGEADYVLALKGNQETLHRAIIEHIDEQLEGDLANCQEHVTIEKGHGREEMRTYLQLPAPESLPGFALWKGLKSIGVVTSCCLRDGKETLEVRYYISSLAVSVKRFAHAVRGHWGIENSCHWSLDITYREDESRIRDQHLRENFAWLRSHHLIATEAASEPQECGHEVQQLRLERELHAGSPYWSNHLVCAGPADFTGAKRSASAQRREEIKRRSHAEARRARSEPAETGSRIPREGRLFSALPRFRVKLVSLLGVSARNPPSRERRARLKDPPEEDSEDLPTRPRSRRPGRAIPLNGGAS